MASSTPANDDASTFDRGPSVFAVTTATLALATVFVAARIACRYFIVRNVSWDDKIMLLAWVIAFAMSFTIDLGVANGLGNLDSNITPENRPLLLRCLYVFSILYNPALMATKTSILIFYLRLAKNTQIILRYASWAILAVVNLAGLVLTIMNIFQCSPISAAWQPDSNASASCIPILTEFICAAPVNVITDLAILALPIPVLTGMRLPSRQKTILILTFTLGIFVTVVDVVRIYYLQRALLTESNMDPVKNSPGLGGVNDAAWNSALAVMWSAVEVNVGMACACVPTLKPLILKLLPAMLYNQGHPSSSGESKASHASENLNRQLRPADGASEAAAMVTAAATTTTAAAAKDSSAILEPQVALRAVPPFRNESAVGALEFLAMPADMHSPDLEIPALSSSPNTTNPPSCRQTVDEVAEIPSSVEHHEYFGFVNMTKPKSMLTANAAESLKYCAIVSILFLIWGFSYGLLNGIVTFAAVSNNFTDAQIAVLRSVYFGAGYFFGPLLVGEWILRRDEHNRSKRHQKSADANVGGFKVTFIVGLCIYGIGTIIFWPSSATGSYGGFLLSNFVVGFGLSVLEVGANTFMILCGPMEYGETRLLLAQGLQGAGSALSSYVYNAVIAVLMNQNTVIRLQWVFLGVTLLCAVLSLFFFYMPLPEVSDQELEQETHRLSTDPKQRSIGGLQLRTVCLILAVLTQYLYVGCQEANMLLLERTFPVPLITTPDCSATPFSCALRSSRKISYDPQLRWTIFGLIIFASRFLAAFLTYLSVRRPFLPQPRTYLGISVGLCLAFALLLSLYEPNHDSLERVIPYELLFFAEGPIWPLLFSIGLRGQGLRTKRAAAFITMGGSGAAFIPFICDHLYETTRTVRSLLFIVGLQILMLTYPLFLRFSCPARQLVDPRAHDRCSAFSADKGDGVHDSAMTSHNDTGCGSGRRTDDPDNEEKPGRLLHSMSRGLGARLKRPRKLSQQADVEHHEGNAGSAPPSQEGPGASDMKHLRGRQSRDLNK